MNLTICATVSRLWVGPVLVIVAMALVIVQVGVSAAPAIGTLLIINALQGHVGALFVKLMVASINLKCIPCIFSTS